MPPSSLFAVSGEEVKEMTSTLTSTWRTMALLAVTVLLAIGIPTALGGGHVGPVLHGPPGCGSGC